MGAKRFQCRYCGIKKDWPKHYSVADDMLPVLASESKHMCTGCYKDDKLLRDAEGEGPSAQPAVPSTGASRQNSQGAPSPGLSTACRARCTARQRSRSVTRAPFPSGEANKAPATCEVDVQAKM